MVLVWNFQKAVSVLLRQLAIYIYILLFYSSIGKQKESQQACEPSRPWSAEVKDHGHKKEKKRLIGNPQKETKGREKKERGVGTSPTPPSSGSETLSVVEDEGNTHTHNNQAH